MAHVTRYARSVAAGMIGALLTVFVQCAVRLFLPSQLHHLGGEIFAYSLSALVIFGFVSGLLLAPRWRQAILAQSLLANPAPYYWVGWIIVPRAPAYLGSSSYAELGSLLSSGLVPCGLAWLGTLVGLWLGRFRALSDDESARLCQHCGYNLTGNVSGHCPECGHAIQGSTEGEGQSRT